MRVAYTTETSLPEYGQDLFRILDKPCTERTKTDQQVVARIAHYLERLSKYKKLLPHGEKYRIFLVSVADRLISG